MKTHLAPLVLCIAAIAGTASAHHSLKPYDTSRTVALAGVIRRVNVVNPHVMIQLEQKDSAGGTVLWDIEMASPGVLKRHAFDLQLLETGRQVTVESWLRKGAGRVRRGIVREGPQQPARYLPDRMPR